MTAATEALVERIVDIVPDFRPLLEEFRAEQLGEMWEAVFLDEATRGLVSRAMSGEQAATSQLQALASFLEGECGKAEEIDAAIDGFLTPFPSPGEPGHDLVQMLGGKLKERLDRQRQWRTRPEEAAFVDRLVQAVPALASVADENRAGDHDDVLPNRFLADVAFRQVENHLSGNEAAQSEVRAVLAALEAEFGSDDGVDTAIATSFLENLPYPGEPGADIVNLLGPKLREELLRQRSP
ncbi:MAG TPA: hypothetical protein VIL34_03000 [Actinopolymorphaceae bacterium]|jgi:hypothetical protein